MGQILAALCIGKTVRLPHLISMKHLTAACLVALSLGAPAFAQSFDQVVQAEVLPGWRNADGSHTAALKITLNPEWKTYWRAPGDAGIPPQISWTGSRNLRGADVVWPTPEVFYQNGMRSIGYTNELILPVEVDPRRDGKPVMLKAQLDIGVCRDICVPQTLNIKAELPPTGDHDARISAAMANQPMAAKRAGVRSVQCRITPTDDGVQLTAKIDMPHAGGTEVAVIEADDPQLWVAESTVTRQGGTLVAETELMHVEDEAFMVDRSGLRITVLGDNHAVDIQGCSS